MLGTSDNEAWDSASCEHPALAPGQALRTLALTPPPTLHLTCRALLFVICGSIVLRSIEGIPLKQSVDKLNRQET